MTPQWAMVWVAVAGVAVSFTLAAMTFWYVRLTRELVLTERKAEITSRLTHSNDDPNFLFLEIRNEGRGAAHNVQLHFSPDAYITAKRTLSDVFGHFSAIMPGESFQLFFGSAMQRDALRDRFPELLLTVTACWSDGFKSKRSGPEVRINLMQYDGLPTLQRVNPTVTALERLGDAIAISGLLNSRAAGVARWDGHEWIRVLDKPIMWLITKGRRVRHDTVLAFFVRGGGGQAVHRTVYELLGLPIGSPRFDSIVVLSNELLLPDSSTKIVIIDCHTSYSGRVLNMTSGSLLGGETVIRIAVLRTVVLGQSRTSRQVQ